MQQSRGDRAFEEIRIHVHDGLEIYGRRYPAPGSRRRPLLCLSGLTRNSRDFHDLAIALTGSGETSRAVFTMDVRGRGESEFAGDWRQYAVPVEMLDVQDFMAAQQLHGAAVLGTSRGGLIAMVLAAAQPSLVGAVILNDVGPRIEREGLVRLQGFVGGRRVPVSWEAAGALLAEAEGPFFPELGPEDWRRLARQRFNEKNERPAAGYDPALARTFDVLEDGPIPELWGPFDALAALPCLVIRGELSDLLSETTVAEMCARHPNCRSHTVPRQGHAPLLADAVSTEAIAEFLAECD